jgi:hypothetical protein
MPNRKCLPRKFKILFARREMAKSSEREFGVTLPGETNREPPRFGRSLTLPGFAYPTPFTPTHKRGQSTILDRRDQSLRESQSAAFSFSEAVCPDLLTDPFLLEREFGVTLSGEAEREAPVRTGPHPTRSF